MNLTEPKPPVSSNPYVAQILPMFQGEIDFREYGSAVQDQITAQEVMVSLQFEIYKLDALGPRRLLGRLGQD